MSKEVSSLGQENDDDWLQAHALTYGVNGDAKQKRITAMMEVNQCSIRFQRDTGADINTINQRFVRKSKYDTQERNW